MTVIKKQEKIKNTIINYRFSSYAIASVIINKELFEISDITPIIIYILFCVIAVIIFAGAIYIRKNFF